MILWVWFTETFFGWKWMFLPCNRYNHDITRCPGHWERIEG